jgi:hypothetical protein
MSKWAGVAAVGLQSAVVLAPLPAHTHASPGPVHRPEPAVLAPLPAHTHASPGPVRRPEPAKLWLIKDNDLGVIGTQYQPLFAWVVCGVATANGPGGVPGGACSPGQVPTYGSYFLLKQAIADGQVVTGQTILFDQEPWVPTPPREQAKPGQYARMIGKLCQAHGIRLVFTATDHVLSAAIPVDKIAAHYAYAVSIQTQRNDYDPAKFIRFARRAVKAVRAANPKVRVMIGLAPDASGHPVTAADIVREYWATYSLVDGFWLNSNAWGNGTGCAPVGCPEVSDKFLAEIASSSSVRAAARAGIRQSSAPENE